MESEARRAASVPDAGDDLVRIEASCWRWLDAAVGDRESPLRTPVLATGGSAGVEARSVILRAVEPVQRALVCYSDARARKVMAIARDPRVAWAVYDPAARIQLRLSGTATVHRDDAVAAGFWHQVPDDARDDYLGFLPPGSAAGAGRPGSDNAQRHHFAVIRTVVQQLDVLFLRRGGHRRAGFDYDHRGALSRAIELQP